MVFSGARVVGGSVVVVGGSVVVVRLVVVDGEPAGTGPGPPETDPQPVVAVVGGTGEFRNARGQVFRLPGPTPDEIKLVFALLL